MNLFTNNPDFYPTPREVIEQMMMGENVSGKVVLEPSAGSGNIVDWLKENGAEVIACENDGNCRKLLADKCRLIADDFLTVTPGIRFESSAADDQKRVMTPAQAREAGSDYIVVGRPVTAAERPIDAYARCREEFLERK